MKKCFLFLMILVLLFTSSVSLVGCSSDVGTGGDTVTSSSEEESSQNPVISDGVVDTSDSVMVALEIKDYGKIVLELYPNEAPITVENFLNYVEKGFYDGLIFQRVIENFLIQGGDPTGTGYGDRTLETIKGEFYNNGVGNDLKFESGVIGMARSNDPNSASTQFFIMHKTTSSLDGLYAAFGKVVLGTDVVDAIATCEKTDTVDAYGNHYVPAETVVIEKAYIVK